MHIGLVQVAIKPLVKGGVDAPIYMALRDKRLKKYKTFLLTMIQKNICNGPVFFNCYPDFSVDLICPMALKSLKLDIHVQGDEFFNYSNFIVIYRVYFRLLSTNLNTKFSIPLPSNPKETVLLEIKDDKTSIFTPKLLKLDEIIIPEEFVIENNKPTPLIERDEIDQIIEEPNGRVTLKFKSFRESETKAEPSILRRSFFGYAFLEKHLVKDLPLPLPISLC